MANSEIRNVNQFKSFMHSIGCDTAITPTKDEIYNMILGEMMTIENEMLEIENLPKTIPNWYIVSLLQTKGFCGIFKKDDKLYCSFGSLGGKFDYNYFPKEMIIANPYLNISKSFEIGKDIAIIKHDRYMIGLNEWNRIHAYNLTEAWCSLRIGLINSRAEYVLNCDDDNEAEGAKKFIEELEKGEHIAHLKSTTFLDKSLTNSIPYSNGAINSIRSAIETMQYIKSDWTSGIGLNSSYSTKREYTSSDETNLGESIIRPKIDQILDTINYDLEICNNMFGTNLKVKFKSIWKLEKEELKLEQDILKQQTKGETENENKDILPNNE